MAEIIRLKRWKVPFVSLAGDRYDVRIYTAAGEWNEQEAVVLKGAAEPFVTEEENSADITTWVRSSTGYVKIVTEDYTLMEQMMPKEAGETRVTLVRHAREDETDQTDRVMWEGYLMPEAFTQEWCAGPWEIQLPAVSRLGMVMDDYLSSGNTGILTVGQWLARVCGYVYRWVLVPDDELMASGQMPLGQEVVETPTALQLGFSEEVFKEAIPLSERTDPEDTTSGLWEPGTNGDIAESLCPVLRWVLREDGDTLICQDPACQAQRYRKYVAGSLAASSPTPQGYVAVSHMDLEAVGGSWDGVRLGGDDGTKEVLMPFGRVSVSGDSDGYGITLINPGDKDWELTGGAPPVNGSTEYRIDTIPFEFYGDASATMKTQRVLDNVEYEATRYTTRQITAGGMTYAAGKNMDAEPSAGMRRLGKTSMLYGNCFPYVVFGLNASEMPHGDYFGGGEICAAHYYYERNGNFTHHRMNSIVLGHLPLDARRYPAVRLRSTLAQMIPESRRNIGYVSLHISGTVTQGYGYKNIDIVRTFEEDGFYGFQMSVKVGDTYIVKDSWGDKTCTLTKEETPFDVLWTKDDDGKFDEYLRMAGTDGFPLTLDAPVEVTIYTPSDAPRESGRALANSCKYLRIDNFRVEVSEHEVSEYYDLSEELQALGYSEIDMSATVGGNKMEEVSVSVAFGGVDSPGALIATNSITSGGKRVSHLQARKVGSLDGEYMLRGAAGYLCQRTLEWLKVQGASTRRALTVPLKADRPWAMPEPMMVSDGDKLYMPVAKSRSWRDDKVMLKMVEVR